MQQQDTEEWECSDDCPIKILGLQSGESKSIQNIRAKAGVSVGNQTTLNTYKINDDCIGGYHDSGTAARYFQNFPPPTQESPHLTMLKQNINHDFFNAPNTPNRIIHGDSLDVLKTLEENSVDSIVCDPPAGISFMNKAFDSDRGGRDKWIAWLRDIMIEALRVVKPGGHALVWALPRTSHWTATALEDAGWEVRDNIVHLFGSGFPKSLNIGKAIDKNLGHEREVVTSYERMGRSGGILGKEVPITRNITSPSSEQAKQYDGQGTALKPAHEVWILCRKPLNERSIAENVLRWGTGGINIDKSRVSLAGMENHRTAASGVIGTQNSIYGKSNEIIDSKQEERAITGLNPRYEPKGRFPANLLISHSVWCIPLGEVKIKANGPPNLTESNSTNNDYGQYHNRSTISHRDKEGQETIQAYKCVDGCPVHELDRQSGISKATIASSGGKCKGTTGTSLSGSKDGSLNNQYSAGYGDGGGASRYFQNFSPTQEDSEEDLAIPFYYAAKAGSRERSRGCEELPGKNNHPTVKNLSLLRYLTKLITPNNGIVLDCFAGSGGTGVACVIEGYHYILIEQSEEYIAICEARLAHAHKTSV